MFAALHVLEALPSILAVASGATPVYIVCLIVGGGLLVISTVFGGHGHDADLDAADVDFGGADADMGGFDGAGDVDVHADFDAGADLHMEGAGDQLDGAGHADAVDAAHVEHGTELLSISTWFSIRFLVYFAFVFGAVGTTLSYMTDMSFGRVLALAIGSGLVVGQGVHQVLRALRRASGGGEARAADFINRPGRVTIAVHPPARGEVGVSVGNKEYFLPAVAKRGDDTFRTGQRVVITKYAGGMAEIVAQEEYEFLNES